MGWGRGRTDPPTAASPIAICNDRYTSIRDIQSVATNVRYGEGFRTPALCRTVVGVLGLKRHVPFPSWRRKGNESGL